MTRKCPVCGGEFNSVVDVAKHIYQIALWRSYGLGRPGRGIIHTEWLEDKKIPLGYRAIKEYLMS